MMNEIERDALDDIASMLAAHGACDEALSPALCRRLSRKLYAIPRGTDISTRIVALPDPPFALPDYAGRPILESVLVIDV